MTAMNMVESQETPPQYSVTSRASWQCLFKLLFMVAAHLLWHLVLILACFDCIARVVLMGAWIWLFHVFTRTFLAVSDLFRRYLEDTGRSDSTTLSSTCVIGFIPGRIWPSIRYRHARAQPSREASSATTENAAAKAIGSPPFVEAREAEAPETSIQDNEHTTLAGTVALAPLDKPPCSPSDGTSNFGEQNDQNGSDAASCIAPSSMSSVSASDTTGAAIEPFRQVNDIEHLWGKTLDGAPPGSIALRAPRGAIDPRLAEARRFLSEATKGNSKTKDRGRGRPTQSTPSRPRISPGDRVAPGASSRAVMAVGNGNDNKKVDKKATTGLPPHMRARTRVPPQASKYPDDPSRMVVDRKENVIVAEQDAQHPIEDTTVINNSDLSTSGLPSDTASHLRESTISVSPSNKDKASNDQTSTPKSLLHSLQSSISEGASALRPAAAILSHGSRPVAAASETESALAMLRDDAANMHHHQGSGLSWATLADAMKQRQISLPLPADAPQPPLFQHRLIDRNHRSPANNNHSRTSIGSRGAQYPAPFIPPYRAIADTQIMPVFPPQEQHVPPSFHDQQSMWQSLPPAYIMPDSFLSSVPPVGYPQFGHAQPDNLQFTPGVGRGPPPGFIVDDASPFAFGQIPVVSPYHPQSIMYDTQAAFTPLGGRFDARPSSPILPRSSQTQSSIPDRGSRRSSAGTQNVEWKIKGAANPKPRARVLSQSECEKHFQKSGIRLSRAEDDSLLDKPNDERLQPQGRKPLPQQDTQAEEDLIELKSDGDDGRSPNSSGPANEQTETFEADIPGALDLIELSSDGDEGLALNPSELVNQAKPLSEQDPSNERDVHKSPEERSSAATSGSTVTLAPLDTPEEQASTATMASTVFLAPLATPEDHPSSDTTASSATLVPQCSPTPDPEATNAAKASKKEARIALKAAWFEREACRKQLISNNHWPQDVYLEFETATNEYNTRRETLAGLMRNGQLNEDDSRIYPKMSAKTTTAPKSRPSK